MPLGQGGPHKREGERSSLKRGYFTGIGSSAVKMVADKGTDMLLIITSTVDELLRNVNIDDLE